jgi:protein gp37
MNNTRFLASSVPEGGKLSVQHSATHLKEQHIAQIYVQFCSPELF